MYPFHYLENKEATPLDFINALSILFKNNGLETSRPFVDVVNSNGIVIEGLEGYAIKAIVGTLNKGRDQGLDTFVGDAVLFREQIPVKNDIKTIPAKDLQILKNFSAFGLYKELRKYSTKFIASRATILLLTAYRRSLTGVEDV